MINSDAFILSYDYLKDSFGSETAYWIDDVSYTKREHVDIYYMAKTFDRTYLGM